LHVAYLLDAAPLFGGVKVVLQQANLLTRRGHRVTVVCPGEAPDWFPLEAELRRPPGLGRDDLPAADVTVATYWTTIPRALEGARGAVVHYCQGFEGHYTHNRPEHAAIADAYRAPVPAMAVAPHLVRLLADRFGRPARVVPQPLEPFFHPPRFFSWRRLRPRRRPRVLVTSPFEIDWKGVRTALEAIVELRRRGGDCVLVRLSQWPLTDAERAVVAPDEFHEHLTPGQVSRLIRGCDLLLAPSWEQEGFGLPALEAMACGVPVIASDVSCFRDWTAGAARLVPYDDSRAFAAAAAEVLGDPRLWRRMRRRGRRVARGFGEDRSADAAEDVLRWVVAGDWRRELG
jgi:glycosyltransferase involved in cell wall biosynthesis